MHMVCRGGYMAVNDLIITAKNNIFKHVIFDCFCQQSCLFIRHEYIITGNMELLLSVSDKTDLVGGGDGELRIAMTGVCACQVLKKDTCRSNTRKFT